MPERPEVAFFEVRPWEEEYFKAALSNLSLRFYPGPLDEGSAAQAADVPIVSVFIRSKVSRAVLDRLPRLRFIATRSTGVDHIDVEAAKERGVVVSNVPAYGASTVAEFTFGLLLSVSRKIFQAYQRVLHDQVSIEDLMGIELNGKTLGVVGTGRIGMQVVRIGRGFGMEVLAYDVKPQLAMAKELGFQYVPLEELLRRSDVVSLHTPYTPETHHLMDRARFSLMKRGSILLNTARGAVVDTGALMWALDEGILAGAGLDVFEGEELLAEERRLLDQPGVEEKLRTLLRHHVLLRYPNVVVTPHVAFFSREAVRRVLEITANNIRSFLAGHPQNVVT